MRKKRPPEQMSALQTVREVPQALDKNREKHSGRPNRTLGKGETKCFRKSGLAGQVNTEHGSGDRRQPSQLAPEPGKVVLLRRDSPLPTSSSNTTTSTNNSTCTAPNTSTKKKSSPKKKVEWIPYTAAPASPELSPVWIFRQRGVLTQHRQPSSPTPIDQMDNLSLNEPLFPLDMESPGAGEGSCVLGLRAPRWTESRADRRGRRQEFWPSGCLVSEGHRVEAETQPDSPCGDGGCYYSSAPASSGGMMPFRRKKRTNLRPSISWADDDYWASWDGWNEVIDWEDNKPPKRRGRNRNREGKRNGNHWGNKEYQQ